VSEAAANSTHPALIGMQRYQFLRQPIVAAKFSAPIGAWAAIIIASILTLAAAPASAQVTWRMTSEYPQNNISGIGLVTFSKLVAERTRGFVTTTTAFDNELKISSSEMPRAAQGGRIIGGDAFAGALTDFDAVFGLSTLPFVVQSVEVARALNTRARPLYEQALQGKGLKLLYLTIWPATGLWSDRPLGSADDLRQLSVRTYDNNSAEVMRAVASSAKFLPMDEAIAALKEHRLNALLTSGDGGSGRKLWDYLPYFTPINYAMPVSLAFVRSEAFASLPEETQKQVLAAAAETEQSQFDLLAHRTAENYARMRASGINIAEAAPAPVVAVLRRAAADPIAAWRARVAPDAVEILEWAIRQ
jgi:TRAP-type C4-dicarboxylate transport system substrate-binding protein